MISKKLRKFAIVLTALLGFGQQARALPIEISFDPKLVAFSWSGKVESVTLFSANALPITVAVGDRVQGSATFDQLGYNHETYIQGNIEGGYSYSYAQGLRHTVSIGGLNWVLDAGAVSLIDTHYPPIISWRSFDIFSTSKDGGIIEFPNLVGDYEAGIALFDDELPYDLYDSNQLGNAVFDFSAAKFGSGSVSARERNQSRDIVSGYYISFKIDTVTVIDAVPIPGTAWLICVGIAGLAAFRKRN